MVSGARVQALFQYGVEKALNSTMVEKLRWLIFHVFSPYTGRSMSLNGANPLIISRNFESFFVVI